MKDHEKIMLARKTCRQNGKKYMIKNDALFISKNGKYVQVCFNLLNLTNNQIIQLCAEV